MGDDRDMFDALGWEKEIRSLADPHIAVNLSPEFLGAAGNQSSDASGASDEELFEFQRIQATLRL